MNPIAFQMQVSLLCRFTLELFLNSTLINPGGNVFMSPWSVYSALSLTLAGASGQTQQQLFNAMHLNEQWKQSNENNELFHQQIGKLLRLPIDLCCPSDSLVSTNENKKSSSPQVKIALANRIFLENNYNSLKQSYLNNVLGAYESQVTKVPFVSDSQSAVLQINQWVEEQTNNKIKNLLSKSAVSAATRLVLVNAVYFKGRWDKIFKKSLTKNEKFYGLDLSESSVPMMHRQGDFPFKDLPDLNARMLWIPFRDQKFYLSVILPNERTGLTQLEEKLSKLNDDMKMKLFQIDEMENSFVDLKIPRVHLESDVNMKSILDHQMGIHDMFTMGVADFSQMTSAGDLVVDDVVHKAFFEMDEEGAEAAAATGVVVQLMSMPMRPDKPLPFHVDHPFLLAIVDAEHGMPLFIGNVKTL